MSNICKWVILLLIVVNVAACGDAKPQVDFLINPSLGLNTPPGSASSTNLSPTEVVTDGVYKIKGRVSSIEGQSQLSGGSYKIKGKISFQ
ncbi:hypothetical protein [Bdellovibrio sp. HCB337]|uniref:hypothetical protein n=1 Tax=Bdellovibrio sp. HCB337 TaxID=3394358 RepID=UPI0039A557F2